MKISRLAALAGTIIAAGAIVGSGAANAVHPPTTITPYLYNRFADKCVTDLGNGGVELGECQWQSDLFTSMIPSQRWGELKVRDDPHAFRVVRIHNGRNGCLTSSYHGIGARVSVTPCSSSPRQVWDVQPVSAGAPFQNALICSADNYLDNLCVGTEDGRTLIIKQSTTWGDPRRGNWDLG
ncbi:hypothetical protein ACFWF7_21355 [Nocardia sp. NPDC060256]|uniref:hypothetical protein n=1 Tax=unclassified Nocardia TaxID=2637762 RepID=UPI00365585F8